MLPIAPEDIATLLTPDIIFLSVPRTSVLTTGPFESLVQPLLGILNIPSQDPLRVIVPSLARQQPSILQRFPEATAIGSTRGFAQASMRTIALSPDINYAYYLKLALACQITFALRTITPWSALGGPSVSELLVKLLPEDMWVYREVASVTGAQSDFSDAKHLSCILREDLESRAKESGECLIMAAALTQRGSRNGGRTYAEVLFGLENIEQKLSWFRS